MSFEQQNNEERRISFQQPVRRYFKALDNLDPEIYYDLYSETQKIFQHELGLSYDEWILRDGAADYKLLYNLGLPTRKDYEADFDKSICQSATMVIRLLGPLVESRVRTFDEVWQDFNKGDQTKEGSIEVRDMELWYLNASRGAMSIYEKHSIHSARCARGEAAATCQTPDSCPVIDLCDKLTTRAVFDGDSQRLLEIDETVGLEVYQQKMHTAYELGLITKTGLESSQRWTK